VYILAYLLHRNTFTHVYFLIHLAKEEEEEEEEMGNNNNI
jgi:hypothetical protein